MREPGLEQAVNRIRSSRPYKTLVWAYRFGAIGLIFVLLTVASIPFRSVPVAETLFAVAFVAATIAGVGTWIGLLALYGQKLMPRGGTNRHRELMKAFWKDVAPIRRS
jgi:hypothetical protein